MNQNNNNVWKQAWMLIDDQIWFVIDMRYQVNTWVLVKEQVYRIDPPWKCYMDYCVSVISNSYSDNNACGPLTWNHHGSLYD